MKKVLLVDLNGIGKQSINAFPPLALLRLANLYKEKAYDVYFHEVKQKPKIKNPDIICFSTIFSFNDKSYIRYINAYIKAYPSATIRIGGPAVSINEDFYKKYLRNGNVEITIGQDDEIEKYGPDYSIKKYNFSAGYTTKGCSRKCPWCVVPKIEPKTYKDKNWTRFIGYHRHFNAMDNNILIFGASWLSEVLKELRIRKKTIDFNQGMDCRIFVKNKKIQDVLLNNSDIFSAIRFSWDSEGVSDYAKKTSDILASNGIHRKAFWYMLIGFEETPKDVWNRIVYLANNRQSIKPMPYRNLSDGKIISAWAQAFQNIFLGHWFINGIITEIIVDELKTYENMIKFMSYCEQHYFKLSTMNKDMRQDIYRKLNICKQSETDINCFV